MPFVHHGLKQSPMRQVLSFSIQTQISRSPGTSSYPLCCYCAGSFHRFAHWHSIVWARSRMKTQKGNRLGHRALLKVAWSLGSIWAMWRHWNMPPKGVLRLGFWPAWCVVLIREGEIGASAGALFTQSQVARRSWLICGMSPAGLLASFL